MTLSAPGLRIASWNVNGLRACSKKGFFSWLDQSGAQIVGIQEMRMTLDQLTSEFRPSTWHFFPAPAKKSGYSGVALYGRTKADEIWSGLGQPVFDDEGRVCFARYGRLLVINSYFPNGSGKERDNSRVGFKLDYYRALWERAEEARREGLRVVVLGDFNTAHRDIDLARPKDNRKTSGFLPEECAELDRWLSSGWTDTFRVFENGPHHYSWWSQRQGARTRNVGWRIDYIYAAAEVLPFLRKGWIEPSIQGSDHCPIGIDLSADVSA